MKLHPKHTTEEERILKNYKRLKSTVFEHNYGCAMWMALAVRWKKPIKTIKAIIAAQKPPRVVKPIPTAFTNILTRMLTKMGFVMLKMRLLDTGNETETVMYYAHKLNPSLMVLVAPTKWAMAKSYRKRYHWGDEITGEFELIKTKNKTKAFLLPLYPTEGFRKDKIGSLLAE